MHCGAEVTESSTNKQHHLSSDFNKKQQNKKSGLRQIQSGSPRAFFWDDILAAPVQHHDVRVDESILEKNIYYNCPNCREKK
jgi:hypothetical protein